MSLFSLSKTKVLCFLSILLLMIPVYIIWSSEQQCYEDHTKCEISKFIYKLLNFDEKNKVSFHNNLFAEECCLDIAHAGGIYQGKAYTNSLEALNENYDKGRLIFELDFMLTSDGYLVLTHHFEEEIPTRKEFLEQNIGFTHIDMTVLLKWLNKNKDAMIITDTKNKFDDFWNKFTERVPRYLIEERFVIQVYNIEQLNKVRSYSKALPVILTIYKTGWQANDMLDLMAPYEKDKRLALTVPYSRSYPIINILRKNELQIPVYIHGPSEIIRAKDTGPLIAFYGGNGVYR